MNTKSTTPFDEILIDKSLIVADVNQTPVQWSTFARQNYLTGMPITAEELVNSEFDILRAKVFDSSFEGQDHAWFCIIRKVGETEVYQVTLGGGAVVEILDAYAATGSNQPLRVKLSYKTGGKFAGYYVFE